MVFADFTAAEMTAMMLAVALTGSISFCDLCKVVQTDSDTVGKISDAVLEIQKDDGNKEEEEKKAVTMCWPEKNAHALRPMKKCVACLRQNQPLAQLVAGLCSCETYYPFLCICNKDSVRYVILGAIAALRINLKQISYHCTDGHNSLVTLSPASRPEN
jgi:hypothetical protein